MGIEATRCIKALVHTGPRKEIRGMSDNSGEFSGKTVLVTGASSGIGRAAAIQLAGQGATVVVAARREVQGRGTVEAITADGGVAEFIAVDIADQAGINALLAAI